MEDFEDRLQRALRAEKEEGGNWFSSALFHELLRRYGEQEMILQEQEELMSNLLKEQVDVQIQMRQYFKSHWGEHGVVTFNLMMKQIFNLPK